MSHREGRILGEREICCTGEFLAVTSGPFCWLRASLLLAAMFVFLYHYPVERGLIQWILSRGRYPLASQIFYLKTRRYYTVAWYDRNTSIAIIR